MMKQWYSFKCREGLDEFVKWLIDHDVEFQYQGYRLAKSLDNVMLYKLYAIDDHTASRTKIAYMYFNVIDFPKQNRESLARRLKEPVGYFVSEAPAIDSAKLRELDGA